MIWPEDDRIRRAFAATAKRYDDHARRRFRRIAKATVELAGPRRGERVLDVACGSGLVARVMNEMALPEPIGLDISSTLLRLAPMHQRIVADALALPFQDEAFDTVICSLGLQMLSDPHAGLSEMHRVLKGGGKIGISMWGDPGTAGPIDDAAYGALNRLVQKSLGNDAKRWNAAQEVIEDEAELRKALEDAGFDECRTELRRKRSAFRDAEHYFEMLTIFPTAWIRLDALDPDQSALARKEVIRAIEDAVGQRGPFEVEEESIIAGAVKAVV